MAETFDQTTNRTEVGALLSQELLERRLPGVLTAKGLEKPDFAVIVPVVCAPEGPYLLVEVRANGIPQAGDPCFPGGRIEPGETPAEAASREMAEELAVCVPPERFLGQLPTVSTPLGARTNVFVCTVSPDAAERAARNAAEVSALLRVPVFRLLEREHERSFPFGGHIIWGMTAGAIRSFLKAWRQADLPDGRAGTQSAPQG